MKLNVVKIAPPAAVAACFFFCAISSRASGNPDPSGTIYLIAQDIGGHSIVQSVPEQTFTTNLSSVFSAVQGGLLPALKSHEAQAATTSPGNLELRTVGVGVGLIGQIGLGPLFNILLNPRLRLVFSNSKTPDYPQ